MHIADIVLTIIEQVFDIPLILSHKFIEPIEAFESTVELNFHR